MGYQQDYIGSRTIVAQHDSLLQDGIMLGRGARLVYPDNLGGAYNARTLLVRSMPVDLIRSNLNLSGGVSFSRRPSVTDHVRSLSDNAGLNAGIALSSNISDRVDFRLSYQGNYNIVTNSARPELDVDYFSGRARGGFNLIFGSGLVLASDFNIRHYAGLGDGFNRNTVYWNTSIGYKFLENDAAEIKMTALDVLAQNDNVNRSISDDYIDDYRTNVLSRYFMVAFTYNFRSFTGGGR
jgi:hypothetical protein